MNGETANSTPPISHTPPVSRRMIVLLALLLVIQLRTDRPASAGAGPWDGVKGLRILAEVHKQIRERAPHPPSDRELYMAAIQGMLMRLNDPYTEYLPPDMRGHLESVLHEDDDPGGIGILPRFDPERGLVVQETVPGGPAEEAGMQPGDVILRIEGAATILLSQRQVYERLRGASGTRVEIEAHRPGEGTKSITITRAPLPRPRAVSQGILDTTPRIGMLRIFAFVEGLETFTRRAINEMESNGAEGLIIDLRWNAGGSFDQSVALADQFLSSGTITTTERRIIAGRQNETEREVFPASSEVVTTMPVVILVNNMTASSSELFTAALQENDRAVVVGTTTVGKGRFQEVTPLADTGGALVLTVGRYLTPDGRDIQGKGVEPDHEVSLTPVEEQAVGRAWVKEWYNLGDATDPKTATDPQLEKAIAVLREIMKTDSTPSTRDPQP